MATFTSLSVVAIAVVLGASALPKGWSRAVPARTVGGHSDFDFFFFVRQWPGDYCSKHSCPKLHDRGFHFTIHGLWPNYDDGTWPEFCRNSQPFDPSLLSDLEDDLEDEWPSFMGNNDDAAFWKHEWDKHGVCALDVIPTEHAFFQTVLDLHQKYNLEGALSDAGILPSTAHDYRTADIADALEAGLGVTPLVHCYEGKLAEVWLCMGRDLVPFNCGDQHAALASARMARHKGGMVSATGGSGALASTACRTRTSIPPVAASAAAAADSVEEVGVVRSSGADGIKDLHQAKEAQTGAVDHEEEEKNKEEDEVEDEEEQAVGAQDEEEEAAATEVTEEGNINDNDEDDDNGDDDDDNEAEDDIDDSESTAGAESPKAKHHDQDHDHDHDHEEEQQPDHSHHDSSVRHVVAQDAGAMSVTSAQVWAAADPTGDAASGAGAMGLAAAVDPHAMPGGGPGSSSSAASGAIPMVLLAAAALTVVLSLTLTVASIVTLYVAPRRPRANSGAKRQVVGPAVTSAAAAEHAYGLHWMDEEAAEGVEPHLYDPLLHYSTFPGRPGVPLY